MRALTLHQPWASLVACGVKFIETRSWPPPRNLHWGDRIAIHSSMKKPYGLIEKGDNRLVAPHSQELWKPLEVLNKMSLPLGCVIATGRVMDAKVVVALSDDGKTATVADRVGSLLVEDVMTDPYGDFAPGRWLWFLADIEEIDPPIKARGFQRLWSLPDNISNQLKQ